MKKIVLFLMIMGMLIAYAAVGQAGSKKVFSGSNEITKKKSGGRSISGTMDVVETPSSSSPGSIPVPCPNVSSSKDSKSGKKKDKLKKNEKKVKSKNSISRSTDDEASTAETKKLKRRGESATLKSKK